MTSASARFDFVPFGSVHHADYLKQSAPLEPSAYRDFMRGEIANMRALGMTSYDMNFAWFDLEIRDGRFDWRRTDAVFELCQEFELPIFGWVFAELTPRWLIRSNPDAAAVAATGYRGPSHSYGSVVARQHLRRYIHRVVERYGEHVLAWNVGIESGLFWIEEQDSSEPAARLWDYNADVVAGFGPWLQKKYGSISELNRIHRDHFEDFDEVEPPNSRFIQEQFMLINQVPWLDWRQYMCDLLTDYIHFKAGCVRELLPDAIVADQSYVIDPAFNGQDIWRTNASMDAIGTSDFVSNNPGEHLLGSYWHDYFRSSAKGKPYWLWELRCGQNAWGVTSWGLPLSAADVGRLTWQALAHEVKNVQYWNWRPHQGGIEVGGHAMTARDGSLTPRARRIGQIAAAVGADPELFTTAALTPAQIAVLDPKLPRIVAAGEGSDELVTDAQLGAYTLLRTLGHRVDFLHEDEVEAGLLNDYRVLVIPFGYALRQVTAERVRDWVGSGGSILAGMFCGTKDEHGYGQEHNPGLGLHEVFGAEENELTPCYSENDATQTNMSMNFGAAITGRPRLTVVATVGEYATARVGDTFAGYAMLSRLTLAPFATALAHDETGHVVVSHSRYGGGQAMLVGTVLHRPEQYLRDGLRDLVADFLQAADVTAPTTLSAGPEAKVEAELLRAADGRELLVLLNAGGDVEVHVLIAASSAVRARDVESGSEYPLTGTTGGVEISVALDAGDGRAFRLEHS